MEQNYVTVTYPMYNFFYRKLSFFNVNTVIKEVETTPTINRLSEKQLKCENSYATDNFLT